MRGGIGGRAAVAAAAGLLALPLSGVPLYASSVGSAALQGEVARACPADAGIVLPVTAAGAEQLDQVAVAVAHARPPVRTALAVTTATVVGTSTGATGTGGTATGEGTDPGAVGTGAPDTGGSGADGAGTGGTDTDAAAGSAAGVPQAVVLGWRAGYTSPAAGDVPPLAAGQVAVPRSAAAELPTGSSLALAGGTEVSVTATYSDVPIQPEPAYWCGMRELLRPTAAGVAAAPLLLAEEETVRSAAAGVTDLWELAPDPDGLTRHAADQFVDDMRAVAAAAARLGPSTGATVVAGHSEPGLPALIAVADGAADVVERGLVAPRALAALTAVALLVLVGVALARRHRAELSLRAVRGEGPAGLALRVAEGHAVAALLGTVAGAVVGYGAVRAFGPSPDLDPGALRSSILLALVALLVSLFTVSVGGGLAASAAVDPDPGTATRRRWRTLPWEALPVALAAVAIAARDRTPGLSLVGGDVGRGEVLAQAGPPLIVVALAALAVRPLTMLFRRARRGRPRGSAVTLAWRRIGAEAPRCAVLAASVAVAVGAVFAGSSLVRAADQAAVEKATTFLGSDLRSVTSGDPTAPVRGVTTLVSRVQASVGGAAVQVLGIDPGTFAAAVRWREGASSYPLADLMQVLAVDDMEGAPLPAIVVGPVPQALTAQTLRLSGAGTTISVVPVATADFFPGAAGQPMVVVNRAALAADEVASAPEVWWRDPPANATQQLAAAGALVRGSQSRADVVQPASTFGIGWWLRGLVAFAAFTGACAALASAVLVARRRRDTAAASMLDAWAGRPAGDEAVAGLAVLVVPALAGVVLGVVVGWITVLACTGPLDTASNLAPSVATRFAGGPLLAAAVIAVLGAVAVAVATWPRRPAPATEMMVRGVGA